MLGEDIRYDDILAIEEQAAAEARRELLAKVEGLRGYSTKQASVGLTGREVLVDRAAVIALLDPSR